MEGLVFGGAYIRWEICVTKSIGLGYSWKGNKEKLCVTVPFLLCFILHLRAVSKYKPPGAYVRRSHLTEGFFFLRYEFGGAYTWRGLFSEFYDTSFILPHQIDSQLITRPRPWCCADGSKNHCSVATP